MTAQQRMVMAAVIAGIAGFVLGAGWQYISARGYADRLTTAEADLTFQRLEATLGAATVEAQRDSYELARQLASSFFTGLQQDLERAPADAQPFRDILDSRDAVITALSRSDPQSGSMLAQLFVRYRIAMGEPVGPAAGTSSVSPPPARTGPPDTAAADSIP